MKKRLHVNATVLISIKFEEGGSAEEMSEFQLQFGGYCQEGIIVKTFLVVMRG